MLKNFDIKHVLTTIKNPQANATVGQLHQVILKILVTKDLDNYIFDHIYPWGENLLSIAWETRASYHRTIMTTPGKYIFGRDMLFDLVSFVD